MYEFTGDEERARRLAVEGDTQQRLWKAAHAAKAWHRHRARRASHTYRGTKNRRGPQAPDRRAQRVETERQPRNVARERLAPAAAAALGGGKNRLSRTTVRAKAGNVIQCTRWPNPKESTCQTLNAAQARACPATRAIRAKRGRLNDTSKLLRLSVRHTGSRTRHYRTHRSEIANGRAANWTATSLVDSTHLLQRPVGQN